MVEISLIVAAIIGVVEAVKQGTGMPSRYAPLVAILLGVGMVFFLGQGEVAIRVFEGVVAGLTAMGLYSGGRATLNI